MANLYFHNDILNYYNEEAMKLSRIFFRQRHRYLDDTNEFKPFYNMNSDKNTRYTIMIIPHSERKINQLRISLFGVYFVIFIIVLFFLFIISTTILGSKIYINYRSNIQSAENKLQEINSQLNNIGNLIINKNMTLVELEQKIENYNQIILAQQSVIKSIFSQYETNNLKNQIMNYIISFILGVLSSMFATCIIFIFKRRVKIGKYSEQL